MAGTLRVELSDVHTAGGMVWIGLYDSEEHLFIKEKSIFHGYPVERPGELYIEVPDLTFGRYAVAVFHDVNNNGVLDQNWLGIPLEPFAFADDPGSKWRKPRFEEIDFTFTQDGQVLRMRLHDW